MKKDIYGLQEKWYLIYTNPRAEMKVAKAFDKMGMEYFLPLQRTLKQWSDRKKWVEEPLFKSYIFVRMAIEKSYYQVLAVPGAARIVQFNGRPAEVDQRELDIVKRLLGNLTELAIVSESILDINHQLGDAVEIIAGPLMGCEGRFLNKKGGNQVTIELKTMQQMICVSMPIDYIRMKNQNKNKIA